MGVEENLYRAPEAPVVERPAYEPRPFFSFLAGASCIGGSVPFLILAVGGGRVIVLKSLEVGLLQVLADRRELLATAFIVLCGVCAATLLIAGRSFLTRRGRRGRQILLAFASSFLGLVALIFSFAR